jgi:hypothetical protein
MADKPEKWPQRHKVTKQNCLLKFILVFWCLGGENVFPQTILWPDKPKKMATKPQSH